jgi:hypothetical protein
MPDALGVDVDSNGITLKASMAHEDWPNDLGSNEPASTP